MTKKPYHHGNLKKELIEAGINLVNEEGIANFSLRKVAKRVGVTPTACYNHFLDKEELLESMNIYINELLENELNETIKEAKEKNEKYITLVIAKAYVKFFAEHERYLNFIYDTDNYWIEVKEDDIVGDYKPFNIFKQAAIENMRKFGISEGEYRDNIIAMWAMVHGLAALSNIKGLHYDGDWGELTERILVTKNKIYG